MFSAGGPTFRNARPLSSAESLSLTTPPLHPAGQNFRRDFHSTCKHIVAAPRQIVGPVTASLAFPRRRLRLAIGPAFRLDGATDTGRKRQLVSAGKGGGEGPAGPVQARLHTTSLHLAVGGPVSPDYLRKCLVHACAAHYGSHARNDPFSLEHQG